MGRARRLHASAAAGLLLALVAALAAAGCGSSGSSSTKTGGGSTNAAPAGSQAPASAATRNCAVSVRGVGEVRTTGVACSTAAEVATAWAAERGCRMSERASRSACAVGRYRCLATSADRGIVVGCARLSRSISFVVPRG